MTLWIGLTGGIGTGKSTVSNILKAMSIQVVDADAIARDIVEPGQPALDEITSRFGKDILNSDGTLNRDLLGKYVFNHQTQREELEAILHPRIQAEVKRRRQEAEEKGVPLLVYDVPLLFEKKMQTQFDEVILVSCSEEIQVQRLKKRTNWSLQEIQNRLRAQLPLSQKEKLASWIIFNNGTLAELEVETRKILNEIDSKRKTS